jgi:hypothetical protein
MGLVDRAKNMILTPKEEWEVIASEEPNTGAIIGGYLVPLILAASITWVLGALIFGGAGGLMIGIAMAVGIIVIAIVSALLTAAIINALAKTFNSEPNMGRATQLVVYAMTPQLVAAILLFIPILGWLIFAVSGIYGIYLMYLGFKPVMKTPEEKVVPYMLVSMLVMYVGIGILFAILSAIIVGIVGMGAATMEGFDSY